MTKLSSTKRIADLKGERSNYKDPYYKSSNNIIYQKDSNVFSYVDTINNINVNRINYKTDGNVDNLETDSIKKPVEPNPTKKWPNDVLNDNFNILNEIKKLLEKKINNQKLKINDSAFNINPIEDIDTNQIVTDLNRIIDNSINNEINVYEAKQKINKPAFVEENIIHIQNNNAIDEEKTNNIDLNEETNVIRPFGDISNSELDGNFYLYNKPVINEPVINKPVINEPVINKPSHEIYKLSHVNNGFKTINDEVPVSFVLDSDSNELIHVDDILVENNLDYTDTNNESIVNNSNKINTNLNQIVESFDEILNDDSSINKNNNSFVNENKNTENIKLSQTSNDFDNNEEHSSIDSNNDINDLKPISKNLSDDLDELDQSHNNLNSDYIQSYDFSDVDDYGPYDENDSTSSVETINDEVKEEINGEINTADIDSNNNLKAYNDLESNKVNFDNTDKEIAELDISDNKKKHTDKDTAKELVNIKNKDKIDGTSIATFENDEEKVENSKPINSDKVEDPRLSSPLMVDIKTYKIKEEELEEPKASEHTETINKQVESLKALDDILSNIMG